MLQLPIKRRLGLFQLGLYFFILGTYVSIFELYLFNLIIWGKNIIKGAFLYIIILILWEYFGVFSYFYHRSNYNHNHRSEMSEKKQCITILQEIKSDKTSQRMTFILVVGIFILGYLMLVL